MEYVSFSFILLGIFVHLLLLYSIFDIYYSSPIVKGARNFQIIASNFSAPPPADRLVFFSADGLRARTFFEHPERSPFLHYLIQNGKAASGISQSHVPTESRPGHVALMAGFYEDVSAITYGWKHNPVPFDSTLNQSARAYLWGSPDIVHLFSTNIANAYAEVYAPELEDFASLDAAKLDKWVFERVETLFKRAKNDMSLARQVSTKRSIFFLHLLGLDTNGHGYMPRSEQYLDNIQTVDKGVKQIYELFETHFADNRTAYLFTADHGMTDWGSHGDGTDDEVQIPFIGWGAGIEATNKKTKNMKQPILAQVDIAPLQSALIGASIPVNSFGIIPAELLRTASGGMATEKYRFQAAYANFKQISEQFSIRRAERRAHSFRYLFTECPSLRFDALVRIENEILRLAQLKRYEAAWKACIRWIPIIREALNYFHRYHQFSQGIAIGALFCSWNFALYASLIGHYQHFSLHQLYIPSHPFWLALFMAAALVWAQGLSSANYLYFLAPIFLLSTALNMFGLDWMELYGKMRILSLQFGKKNFDKFLKKWTQRIGAMFICAAFFIPLLVSVFFERSILSLIFVVISIVPWLFHSNRNNNNFSCRVSWLLLCLALAIFPLLDTVGTWPRPWLIILTETICCVALQQFNRNRKENALQKAIQIVQIFHLTALCLLIWDAIKGPNALIQLFAWLSIPTAFCIPLLPFNHNQIPNLALADRLILWSASLQLPYSLLSLGQEALFLCLFTILLFLYARLQHPNDAEFWTNQHTLVVEGSNKRSRESNELANGFKEKYLQIKENKNLSNDHLASISEWSRALFLVICIEMAFFGTGNIASLNSFNPTFLRLFLSVFSPITMATLLLLKVFIPFLIVSIHFVAFNNDANEIESPNKLAKLSTHMALITNSMAMIFFYCLRTDGSWLQIGISISNYVICLVCSAATYLLLHFSNYLLHSHKLPKFLNSSLKYYI